jgi:hypothetical protein
MKKNGKRGNSGKGEKGKGKRKTREMQPLGHNLGGVGSTFLSSLFSFPAF